MTRLPLAVAIVSVLAGCRDVAAPPSDSAVANAQFTWTDPSPVPIHILRQAAGAPRLETYQVSFWVCDGEASTVRVNYLPAAGQAVGQPFLRFDIPKNALVSGPAGERYNRGDSVLVTLTIDPVTFAVHFEPSGVWFSNGLPARLTFWYQNADADLNGDGVTDATDEKLAQQIAVWGHDTNTRWVRLTSDNDPTLPSVSTVLRHFSEYAVSW